MITFSLILATMVKAVTIILFCAIAHSAISLHLGQEAGPQERAGPQEAGPQERAGPQGCRDIFIWRNFCKNMKTAGICEVEIGIAYCRKTCEKCRLH